MTILNKKQKKKQMDKFADISALFMRCLDLPLVKYTLFYG